MIPSIFTTTLLAATESMGASPVAARSDVLHMVLNASPMVRAIMAGLLLLSVFCWGVMAAKARMIRRANRESGRFIKLFIERKDYDELFKESETLEQGHLAYVFRRGYAELKRVSALFESRGLPNYMDHPENLLENVDRAIQGGVIARRKRLYRFLPVLATTGGTAPFIGLFGTVWGIMTSFQEIGMRGSANLAVVAPGISEALVATAMGLAAAIPAVVAYNHFNNKIQSIEDDMLQFTSDFLNCLKADLMCRSGQGNTTLRQPAQAQPGSGNAQLKGRPVAIIKGELSGGDDDKERRIEKRHGVRD